MWDVKEAKKGACLMAITVYHIYISALNGRKAGQIIFLTDIPFLSALQTV